MDIFERIRTGEYENKVPRPSPLSRKDRLTLTAEAAMERLAARQAYYKGSSQAHEKFKADLFEYSGVTGHSKAQRAFDIAWDHSHSDGLSNVVHTFEELADLLR